jgi:nucleotide-binding universal stress UspA family protein
VFRTIVIPTDLSETCERAVECGTALAARLGATVRLTTVASPGIGHYDDRMQLSALAEGIDGLDVEIDEIEANDVGQALVDAATDDDLICMETHGHGPIASMLLGSTAGEVLRRAPRPVLLLGPRARPSPSLQMIEGCIDGPEAIDELVPVLGSMGRDLHARVRLLHVFVRGETGYDSVHTAASDLEGARRRLASEYAVDAGTAVVGGTSAATEIVADAETQSASLIVVALRRHSIRGRRVLGAVAAAVVHSAQCGVLVVPSCPGRNLRPQTLLSAVTPTEGVPPDAR